MDPQGYKAFPWYTRPYAQTWNNESLIQLLALTGVIVTTWVYFEDYQHQVSVGACVAVHVQ